MENWHNRVAGGFSPLPPHHPAAGPHWDRAVSRIVNENSQYFNRYGKWPPKMDNVISMYGQAFRCHFPAITDGLTSISCDRYCIGCQAQWLSKCNFYSTVIINKLHFLPFCDTFRCHL
jgi:hypothetical protein